jgi:hypothetical protein
MFSSYTVLFVGYGHNDPVMNYLARGLPPSADGKRFAIAPEGNDNFWEHLGITALTYPIQQGQDPHRELGIALEQWVAFTAERPLDKRGRVRTIVSRQPPGPGPDNDYLVNALGDVSTTRFFTEFATSIEWLEWAKRRDAFLRLFRSVSDSKATDEPLAWWFAERFALDHSGPVLEWIARESMTIGPLCWLTVAHQISRRMNPQQGCPGLDKWVPLLIRTEPVRTDDQLETILSKCRHPEDANSALLLFQHLLKPLSRLKPNRLMRAIAPESPPDVDVELQTVGDNYWTGIAWQQYFKPNLRQFARPLAAIATVHLEESALLSKAYGERSWDLISAWFPDLAGTSLCSDQRGMGVLVEVAREALFWLIRNAQRHADGLIEAWWGAESLVLRRLAILGIAESGMWAADDRLAWLLDRDLLYKAGFGREVPRVLKAVFREASAEMKDRVIDVVLAAPVDAGESRIEWIHGMLEVLNSADRDCARVAEELAKMPRPSASPQEEEPIPLEPRDLLGRPGAEQVDRLLAFESKYTEQRHRDSLAADVRRAVADKPEWGIELAAALRAQSRWETVLWKGIVAGWNRDGLSSAQWEQVLNLMVDSPRAVSSALDEMVELLERRTAGDANPFLEPLSLPAKRIGAQVWRTLESTEHSRMESASDWLTVSINSQGGKVAEFFLRMAWQERKAAGSAWTGLTADYRAYLDTLIRGVSWAAEMARVVVAASLHMLFKLDAAWTKEHVLQLFDWSAGERRAQQAWHGYLVAGSWDNDLLEHFLPYCRTTFGRIEEHLGKRAESFCELMAGVAIYGAVDPIQSGWLPQFISAATPQTRRTWASSVRLVLEGFPEGKRSDVWTRWMGSYWKKRLGTGPELGPDEVLPMVEWTFEMEEKFPEAVDLVLQCPAPNGRNIPTAYFRLQKSGVRHTYPRETARLLRFLVQSHNNLEGTNNVSDLVRELKSGGAEINVLIDICHQLAHLGDPGAEELREFVERPDAPPTS